MIGNFKLYNTVKKVSQQVHCVVTSPPYFNLRQYGDSSEEIGNEKSLEEYCDNLVSVFNSIDLHSRGSVWVNIGDKRKPKVGLLSVPEAFMFAMMKSGWLLLDKIVWAKIEDHDEGYTEGNCMTEPANGRLNSNGFEMLYRFSRTTDAWSDTCAVAIPRRKATEGDSQRHLPPNLMSVETSIDGRKLHNVWRVNMGQTKKKHYAVYPPALCERPIAMTCPMRVCVTCGSMEERIVEMVEYDEGRGSKRVFGKYTTVDQDMFNEDDASKNKKASGRMDIGRKYIAKKPQTMGWKECGHNCWEPGVVLDPFMGSGTTGEVALKMGRSFVGIDIYDNFINMSKERCEEAMSYLMENNIDPWLLRK